MGSNTQAEPTPDRDKQPTLHWANTEGLVLSEVVITF